MLYKMLVSRLLGDRMFILNHQGRAPFAIAGQGQEACQVGSAFALRAGRDWVYPYYRDIGVVLSLGMTSREIMLHFFARADDPNSGGRQMPNHWASRGLRIPTQSSVVATQVLHATGTALASKLKGQDEVSVAYLGEGGTSQGDFHEALNFASIHKLPVLFFCENNGYAISEAQTKEMAIKDVADRARAYGFRGHTVDGNDVLAVYQTTRWAVEECRRARGPVLIEAKTYRLSPHSSSDDDRRYRTRAEVDAWAKRDPLDRFRTYLEGESILAHGAADEMRARAEAEVQDAVAFAEAQPEPQPASALQHVFAS
jgi:2-oxoisovalerate dehydrogenase E1 component alpha subunit